MARVPSSLLMQVQDPSYVGEARRAAVRFAASRQFSDVAAGNVGIVVTELANNLVRHAGGGTLQIQWQPLAESTLEILAIDRGPGMRNVAACMEDGFSTAGTPGTGLGAVRRLSSDFDIHSIEGRGTVIMAQVGGGGASCTAQQRGPRIGVFSKAAPGEHVSGDIWRVAESPRHFAFMVADGLGHGPNAAAAAEALAAIFDQNPTDAPERLLDAAHKGIAGTRGAAAAVVRLDRQDRTVAFAGVGNIAATIITGTSGKGMFSHNGTVGAQVRKIQTFAYDWPSHATLVMHSDGLQGRWSFEGYPGIGNRHPALVAGLLGRDFERGRDDLTVLVAQVEGEA